MNRQPCRCLCRRKSCFVFCTWLNRRKKRRERKWYVWPLDGNRSKDGEFSMLEQEMCVMDEEKHHHYFRMSAAKFEFLAHSIGERIQHKRTHSAPISVAERLAVTLCHLAAGCSQCARYRLGSCTVSKIIIRCARRFGTLCSQNLSPSYSRHSGWT